MTKEDMLFFDIPIEIAIDDSVRKLLKDMKERKEQIDRNQAMVDKFNKLFKGVKHD